MNALEDGIKLIENSLKELKKVVKQNSITNSDFVAVYYRDMVVVATRLINMIERIKGIEKHGKTN